MFMHPDDVLQSSGAPAAVPLPLIGPSDQAQRSRDAFELAERRRSPVLIDAETGSRASSVCQALHEATRPGLPLVSLDCSTSDTDALDGQLFGETPRKPHSLDLEALGADSALVVAGAGTVFLEYIDELPASAQRRLARILRDGEAQVGPRSQTATIACRVIASASRDLDADVREGRFREDLHRRLAATRIIVAPLRQRSRDLAAIIDALIAGMGVTNRSFTQPAVTVLAALPWPRNIDELASVLKRVIETSGPVIRQEDVLAHLPIDGAFAHLDLTASLRDARRRFERDYIAAVLERHHWRMSEAARTLGIERANLYRKTRQLGITRVARAELS
jgi:DNA-binding NtrC family response regulator